MSEPTPDSQSVLNTHVHRTRRGVHAVVEKRARINVRGAGEPTTMARFVRQFQDQLEAAGVPTPTLRAVEAGEGDGLLLIQDDLGPNLLDREGGIAAFLDDGAALDEVIDILGRASRAGIALDPHPKNFCGAPGALAYVDLWPPYCVVEYRAARLALETDEQTRMFVKACLDVFDPQTLAIHLVGDVLGLLPKADGWAVRCIERARLHGLIPGSASVPEILAQARAIRALEDRRLASGVFLV